MTLDELQNWPPHIKALADAATKYGDASQQAGDNVQAIVDASTWKGDAGDAARDAMARSATRFQTAGSEATTVAMHAAKAYGESQSLASDIGSFLTYAAEPPAVIIDPKTNGVTPPDITGLNKDQLEKVINKLKDLQTRVTGLVARGDMLDDELARILDEGTGADTGPQTIIGDEDIRRHAKQDVNDALAGDREAAKRVEKVLNSIKPGQELTPEQGSYLSQMQAQQNGMTVEELKTAEERLGDQKHIIADSWQLMSNDKVTFPKTGLTPGDLDDPNNRVKGGFDQLPRSVQNAIKSGDNMWIDQVKDIANIVRDGRVELQTGTQLDRELLNKADRIMDTQPFDHPGQGYLVEPCLEAILNSAGRDDIAVHDLVTGEKGNDFIHDIEHHAWADKGAAAATLFPNAGDHSKQAGETVHAFAAYTGEHYQELLNMSGKDSLGQVNPEFVRALGRATAPYIDDMVGQNIDGTQGFGKLDSGGNANNMRGLFAVIDSDETAGKEFNGRAAGVWQSFMGQYSQGLATGGLPDGALLESVGKLQGAMDMGEYIHQLDSGKDEYQAKLETYNKHGQWYDAGKSFAELFPYTAPAAEVYGKLPGDPLRDMFVGEAPTPGTTDPMPLRQLNDITKPIAEYLVHEKVGDLSKLDGYIKDGKLDWTQSGTQNAVEAYLSTVGGGNEFPYIHWLEAYGNATKVSPGEFNKITLPEK
ncbi:MULTISPECIES: WXG100 family type VII secretion target [unclassified Mycobacteroides]|uniref:WXG100 family type VII secretion target n=1 Tax=unclassified Mycobacteroides TaxID=2618759 RepID=UPI0012DC22D3|nr:MULTISPECIES: WXG100 family type VII secretion target [unclassified Mycobacteroides]MUM16525.1 hypothetical protein [Mycobacteroides sp. CBMA 326]